MAARGRFPDSRRPPVHYVADGEGPDLVLIHGASGNTRDFTHALAGVWPRVTA
jgi:pimeloyl-ACP methyl ester carboxylesterase